MIVLDASAATELVLHTPIAAQLVARLGNEVIHAPHLIDLEVCSALRTLERTSVVARAEAEQALADFLALELVRHPHDLLVDRIWALRANITPYDASYIALAEALGAPVVTCDRKLAHAPGHHALVELIS